MQPPLTGHDWVALSEAPLPASLALDWVAVPSCGASVLFTGNVRDHAEGRTGVEWLEYEAYEEQAVPRLSAVALAARDRWADIGRIALMHRTGRLHVGEVAVVVAVSSPHRDVAFDAARYCIDAVKATVPIWKRESWEGRSAWGTGALPITEAEGVHR